LEIALVIIRIIYNIYNTDEPDLTVEIKIMDDFKKLRMYVNNEERGDLQFENPDENIISASIISINRCNTGEISAAAFISRIIANELGVIYYDNYKEPFRLQISLAIMDQENYARVYANFNTNSPTIMPNISLNNEKPEINIRFVKNGDKASIAVFTNKCKCGSMEISLSEYNHNITKSKPKTLVNFRSEPWSQFAKLDSRTKLNSSRLTFMK
jgi:hypothetical protein